MKAWRAYLAIFLIFISHFGVLEATLCLKNPILVVASFFGTLVLAMLAVSFAQDDGRVRGRM